MNALIPAPRKWLNKISAAVTFLQCEALLIYKYIFFRVGVELRVYKARFLLRQCQYFFIIIIFMLCFRIIICKRTVSEEKNSEQSKIYSNGRKGYTL